MFIRRLALTALTATALTGLAAPASAQQIDRIVTFGDSYADDGNFFQILGINPATTTIYTSGRFSGTEGGRCGSGSRSATSAPTKGQMAEKPQTAS